MVIQFIFMLLLIVGHNFIVKFINVETRMALSRAHTSTKAQQPPFITIDQTPGKVYIPQPSFNRNTVLPGMTWNVNHNPTLTLTLK